MMTTKSVLTRISFLLFCIGLAACSKEELQDDGFEVPTLTDENTIQFTIPIEKDGWRQIEIVADGGRIAIDWGDGRFQRIADPSVTHPVHKYGNVGSYRVKVWAEEVSGFSIINTLLPIEDVQLGDFPRMRYLTLNTCNKTEALDLSKSCPNLESVNIGNCQDLKHIDISKCTQLEDVSIYTNESLTELDLSHNVNIRGTLSCSGNNLTTLSVKGLSKLTEIECSYNPLLSDIEVDEEGMKITKITARECDFTSMDFLEKLPLLTHLNCSKNRLTSLTLPAYPDYLHCEDNLLEEISFPKMIEADHGRWMKELDCHSNQLSAEALNRLFDLLDTVPAVPHPRLNNIGVVVPQSKIAYWDNPGERTCDAQVLEEKGWKIMEN